MRPIKRRRVDVMLTLRDHEGRIRRMEKFLADLAREATEERGLIVAPTTKQTAAVAAVKGS